MFCRTVSCVESAGFARTSVSVHESVRFFMDFFMCRGFPAADQPHQSPFVGIVAADCFSGKEVN